MIARCTTPMRATPPSTTPNRRISPLISAYDAPTTSSLFRRDIDALALDTADDDILITTPHRRSLSSSQRMSYRVPTVSNGERDSLLPSSNSSSSSPTSAAASRASAASRTDRRRGAVILLTTVLALLVITLYQRLSQSDAEVLATTPTATQHSSHTHEHASNSQNDAVDASALFDEGNDVNVLYHPILVDALPYTTPPLDSSATSVHLHGRYSDSSNFLYPLCTFSRVCTTPTQLHLTVQSNYSVWAYYRTVLPYCHDVLSKRLELCGCFHHGWRPGLLEWRGLLKEAEKAEGERVARRMVEGQFAGLADWTRGWEQAGPAIERPTVEQLQQMRWVQPTTSDDGTTSWLDRARLSLSSVLPSSLYSASTPGLYPDPFSAPPLRTPPVNWTSPPSNLTLHYYDSHYWSIHKWSMTFTHTPYTHTHRRLVCGGSLCCVLLLCALLHAGYRVDHHHIAHWAQKLLVLYTTAAHYHHACHHTYRKLALTSLDLLTPLLFRPRLEATPAAVSEYVDVRGRTGEVRDVVEGEQWEAGEWNVECTEPLTGVVFHDSWAPFTEHEQHILAVTVEAMDDWMNALDDDEIHQLHKPSQTDTTLPPTRLHQLYGNADAAAITPAAPFSTANNLYTGALFRQYDPTYVESGHYPRHIPPPANHSTLSCFRRLSFSPMYGTFARSAYDLHLWRERAMRHFGIERHQSHHSRSIAVPLLANHTSPYLPVPLHALPPMSRVDHSMSSALSLMVCPPARAVFVTRPDRSVVNVQAIVDRMKGRYNVLIEPVTINHTTPSFEQARLFAGAGLLLSAHSSQMVNVLFSAANSVMIEVTAEFYNIDFFNYARSVGVRFLYALGGEVVDKEDEGDAMRNCVRALRALCGTAAEGGGDSYCVERVALVACGERRSFPNKHKAFEADVDAVERAVRVGLKHLLHTCHGRWGNAQLAKWS